MNYVPSLGSESGAAEGPSDSAVKDSDGTNLCISCLHAEVCAMLTAARVIMPEGGFEVSVCAQFFPTPPASSDVDEPKGPLS